MFDESTRQPGIFSNFSRSLSKIGRVVSDYSKCFYFESCLNPLKTGSIAVRIVRARLLFGVGPYHYSLYRFSYIGEEQWVDYMTNYDFIEKVLFKRNTVSMRQLVKNKVAFYAYCQQNNIPTIPILWGIAKTDSIKMFSEKMIPLAYNLEQWLTLVENSPEELFVKPVDGAHADGVFTIQRCGEQFIVHCCGIEHQLDLLELYDYCLDKLKNEVALIIQPRLRAHREMREISSSHGLPTIRVVTIIIDGNAKVLFACIRLPVGLNIYDNFGDGTNGNLLAPVELDTGVTGLAWASSSKYWPALVSSNRHSDTGKLISGFVIPFWSEAVELTVRAQASLPGLKSIGWDIAITESGPVVVEANGGYGLDLLQVSHQRGLGRELTAIIQEG